MKRGYYMIRAFIALVCAALTMQCASAFAEDTASYWLDKGNESCKEAFNESGNMTLRNLILTDAVESYEKAIQIEPHSSLAWLKKAIAYFEMGNYIEALDSVNRSIEIDPVNADALYMKAGFYGETGRTRDALQAFNETLEVDPERIDAWFWKADFLASMGSYEEALNAYNRTIEIDPESMNAARSWDSKSYVLKKMGLEDQAKSAAAMAAETYDKAIEQNPNDANAWFGKGCNLNDQGRYDEAAVALNRSVELAPAFINAWYFRAVALNATGRYEEAVRSLDKFLEANPEHSLAWKLKGEALSALGRDREAQAAFEMAIVG